jgi:HD-GYP domain-containing protein (c-di-GMP phosphodiesterase class II)
MGIKKIIKISFIVMTLVIFIIAIINTVVLYQIKENDITKQTISNLVLMQEKMNELLKDTTNIKSIEELEVKKTDFQKFELEFEEIEKTFLNSKKDDFIDKFIPDVHNDSLIASNLDFLFKNEKEIEKAFDIVYDLQKEKIRLLNNFEKDYPIENEQRKNLESKINLIENYELYQVFSSIQYYSKETLYQYKDLKRLNVWLEKIKQLKNTLQIQEVDDYLLIVNKVGMYVVDIQNIEEKELNLRKKILNIINLNKEYSFQIENKIQELSTKFINFTYSSILFLLLLVIVSIIILGYKVYRNIGMSVDEIEQKIDNGLSEIKDLNEEIENTQREVVFTMGSIGETRSKETGNHVKRVAEYSRLFAIYSGLSNEEADLLKQASPMHDIGKVAIPDAILNKPGSFTQNEREIMNTHALLGYEMLKHSNRPILKAAAIVAKEHHEKWDGTGYPNALKGEDIHIYGRITAIADVFDALGSDRCYKKAWDDEKIFNLFKEERGIHFDPKLVDIFFEHIDEFKKIREDLKDKF